MNDSAQNLIIIEKYESFLNYIYPHLQHIPRKHGILKERIILIVFEQSIKLFLASWRGHLRSADSWNLVKFINKEEQLWKMKLVLSR